MNIFKALFRKSKITRVDSTLLCYDAGHEKYTIGYQYGPQKPNFSLHRDEVYVASDRTLKLSQEEKDRIAIAVKRELESEGSSVEILPFLFEPEEW